MLMSSAAPDVTRILLVRHGQSEWNAIGRWQGQADSPLSDQGRLQVALGTGEFSNEHITGEPWPRKEVRNARLRECVDVIRALFAGEVVDHDGLVTVDRAKLWTLPAEPPPLLATAVSVETAAFAGEWADGLITINQPHDHL